MITWEITHFFAKSSHDLAPFGHDRHNDGTASLIAPVLITRFYQSSTTHPKALSFKVEGVVKNESLLFATSNTERYQAGTGKNVPLTPFASYRHVAG